MTALARELLAAVGGRAAVSRVARATRPGPAASGVFLTRADLAARWGVCWLTIRRMEKAGRLVPAVRFTQRVRYSLAQIEAIETASGTGKEVR